MSATTTVMGHLDGLRAALAKLPGVRTCKIGLETNISPGDYPMIRIVPSEIRPNLGVRVRSSTSSKLMPSSLSGDTNSRLRTVKRSRRT